MFTEKTMTIPTLDELLERLKTDVRGRKHMIKLYRRVAAGERHPTNPALPSNVVILAAQAMTVLFNHIDQQTNQKGPL